MGVAPLLQALQGRCCARHVSGAFGWRSSGGTLTSLPGHTGAADPDVGAIAFGLMQGLGCTWHRVGPGMQLR